MAEVTLEFIGQQLQRILDSQREMLTDHNEMKTRQSETHNAVLGLRRDQVNDAEVVAHMQAQIDRLRDDINRIKARLEFNDA
jgi:hypothetical protein